MKTKPGVPEILPALESVGLSPKESRLYLALLESGRATVAQLMTRSGYKRGDLHYLLDLLEKKKLIARRRERNRDIIVPESPWRLQERGAEMKKQAEQQEQAIQNLLPDLVSRYVLATNRPAVRQLEGVAGIEEVYAEILRQKKDLAIFASAYDHQNTALDKAIDLAIKRQHRAGIKTRALVEPRLARDRRYLDYCRRIGIANRFWPRADFSLPSQIIVFGDSVALSSLKDEIITTLIQNKNIAQSLRGLFELIWTSAARSEGA